jgi:excisionase family DNA binding protein
MQKRDTDTDNPLLLTITAAAKQLGVSRSSVYRLIGSGALPVVRPLPDAPRITRDALEEYVQGLNSR